VCVANINIFTLAWFAAISEEEQSKQAPIFNQKYIIFAEVITKIRTNFLINNET
jgi:hypothetical protein